MHLKRSERQVEMHFISSLVFIILIGTVLCGEYFTSNGTRYYFSHPMKKNWYQAQRFCHANSMHLATIHTDDENSIILDVIFNKFRPSKDSDHFWSSGTDMGQTDLEFYWAESGYSALYTNWIDGHPIAGRAGCILLHGGVHKYKFTDIPCIDAWYFICQDKIVVPDASKRNMEF